MEKSYICYFIHAERWTYVGVTNNFRRRLRQHNQEIKGGARYTKRSKSWCAFIQVSGFATKRQTLQFEWAMKHKRAKGSGKTGRIQTLEKLLGMDKWTSRADPVSSLGLTISVMGMSEKKYCKHAKMSKDEFDKKRVKQAKFAKFIFN